MPSEHFFEIDFLPVGDNSTNGDAILTRIHKPDADSDAIHLIDGGFQDTADDIIAHINKYYGEKVWITSVVCTHTDQDHASGLVSFIEKSPFPICEIFVNRPWLYATELIGDVEDKRTTADSLIAKLKKAYPYVARIEELAEKKGIKITECFQGTRIGAFYTCAPSKERYLQCLRDSPKTPTTEETSGLKKIVETAQKAINYIKDSWLKDNLREDVSTSPENEMSIVQFACLLNQYILLTGDAGKDSLAEAHEYVKSQMLMVEGANLDFMQIPHHGGRRNVTPSTLNNWLGEILPDLPENPKGYAFASVAKECEDHPKVCVSNAYLRRGYDVSHTKGETICFKSSSAPVREGWGNVTTLSFQHESESWD